MDLILSRLHLDLANVEYFVGYAESRHDPYGLKVPPTAVAVA